jgi:hypothetical protein
MDIIQFFCDNYQQKEYISEFKVLLLEKYNNQNISQLEYEFILNIIKNNCSIVNLEWLITIFEKIISEEINKLINLIFSNYLEYLDNKFRLKTNDIINNFKILSNIKLSEDQDKAIIHIMDFLINYNINKLGIYGYAGSGKTTIIIKFFSYLIKNKYINSIAFTSPTNKALSVMKYKFKEYLKEIAEELLKIQLSDNFNIDSILIKLDKIVKIEFITIHKLLNYKTDYNLDSGSKIFINKEQQTNIKKYEIIIIDECSMIPLNIINHIFDEIRINNTDNYKKKPKVLFIGDPCQLNPVSEKTGIIFGNDITFEEYEKSMNNGENKKIISKDGYLKLINDIINMPTFVMKQIMRNNISNVNNLCNCMREWIENLIKNPKFNKYQGNGVYYFKYDNNKPKIESEWFKLYLENIKKEENKHLSNVILNWTNKQTLEYNNVVRREILKKEKLEKYEIDDVLVLNSFYNMKNINSNINSNFNNKTGFHTSEIIKIIDIEYDNIKCVDFDNKLPKIIEKMKNGKNIITKYNNLILDLNKTNKTYNIWKIRVCKMVDSRMIDDNNYEIKVVHDNSLDILEKDRIRCEELIRNFRNKSQKEYKEQFKTIDKIIIRKLWRMYGDIFEDNFAKLANGYSLTVHKSQGSTFYNVYIDMNDIMKNINLDEAKRCLYTALTRASNNIYLLI